MTTTIAVPGGMAPATVTFSEVTAAGETTITVLDTPPALPATYLQLGSLYYDVETTATYSGSSTICLSYDPADFADPTAVQLLHFSDGDWTDATTSNDPVAGRLCGAVTSFSPFAITALADTTAPETTLAAGPNGVTADQQATFGFTADESDVTFECRLDDAGFAACTSPVEVTNLADGEHTFQVRAIGRRGQR